MIISSGLLLLLPIRNGHFRHRFRRRRKIKVEMRRKNGEKQRENVHSSLNENTMSNYIYDSLKCVKLKPLERFDLQMYFKITLQHTIS